jgi:hypothetical protein
MAAEKMYVLNGMPSDRACLSLGMTSRHLPYFMLLNSLLSCTCFWKVAASGRPCCCEGLAKHATMQCCRALRAPAAAAALCDLAATHVLLLKACVRKAVAACKQTRPRTTPHTCMLLAAQQCSALLVQRCVGEGRRPLGTVRDGAAECCSCKHDRHL